MLVVVIVVKQSMKQMMVIEMQNVLIDQMIYIIANVMPKKHTGMLLTHKITPVIAIKN
jgi:hypothetical protein